MFDNATPEIPDRHEMLSLVEASPNICAKCMAIDKEGSQLEFGLRDPVIFSEEPKLDW